MLLEKSDVIVIKPGMKVYTKIPEAMVYANRMGSRKNLTRTVVVVEDKPGVFSYLTGSFVVTHTVEDGGGTGMGPHDIYPDGHHVFCQKLDDPDVQLDFYQTGSFTAMIRENEIEVIGQATPTTEWTFTPKK